MQKKVEVTFINIAGGVCVTLLADMFIQSTHKSIANKKPSIHFPTGVKLLKDILIGTVIASVIVYTTEKIIEERKSIEEKKLDTLVEKEKEKIYNKIIINKDPVNINWV